MSEIKAFLVDKTARVIVGADWRRVRDWVETLWSLPESGDEKKAILLGWAKEVGFTLSGYLLNFAIEAAVVWAKNRLTK